MNIVINVIMALIFLIGIFLFYYTTKIDYIVKECKNEQVTKANKGLFIMSIALITMAILFLSCNFQKVCEGPIGAITKFSEKRPFFFLFLLFSVGGVIIGLSMIIDKSCKEVVHSRRLINSGIAICSLTLAYFLYLAYPNKTTSGGASLTSRFKSDYDDGEFNSTFVLKDYNFNDVNFTF
jgi:hypothetical protein